MDHQTAIDVFRYDPVTGKLYWADPVPEIYFKTPGAWSRFNKLWAGQETGCPDTGGYLLTRWKGRLYAVHRIIWLMVHGSWPTHHIDHGDHVRNNNRLKNLSDVTQAKNNAKKLNNKSGHPCIFFQKRSTNRPWMVQVYSKGSYLTQQSFAELSDAIAHRDDVRRQHNLPPI